MADSKPIQFGVNVNNREPLIAPDYDLQALLDLSESVGGTRLRFGLGRATACSRSRGTSR